MKDIELQLVKMLERAQHCVALVWRDALSDLVAEQLEALLAKGVAVEILWDGSVDGYLQGDHFAFNRLCLLVQKGACMYRDETAAFEGFWCFMDYEEARYFDLQGTDLVHSLEIQPEALRQQLKDYELKKHAAQPYLVEAGDVQIRFKVSDACVIKGDTVELTWEVDHADKVIIQGLGEVSSYGKSKILIDQNTILKIGAYHKQQSQLKTLQVLVYKELSLHYDLSFKLPLSPDFVSLVNSNLYPHVYGVAMGNQVRLTWDIPEAKSVEILPFGLVSNSGTHVFNPSQSLQIDIKVLTHHVELNRKIQLLVFPIPVFKEKLMDMPALQKQSYTLYGLQELQTQFEKHLQHTCQEEEQRYLAMREELSRRRCAIETKKLNLSRVNSLVFDFLKKTFAHRKGVVSEIQSIEAYYEQP